MPWVEQMGYLISTWATSGLGKFSSTVRILETSMPYTCTSSEAVCKLPITVKYHEDKSGSNHNTFMNQNPKYRDLVFSAPILPWPYDKHSSFLAGLIATRLSHIWMTKYQQSSYDLNWFSQNRSWHITYADSTAHLPMEGGWRARCHSRVTSEAPT